MGEKLIKSADRVKDFGEVFTPKWVVEKMLDQPEIAAKVNDLAATFLEPSAGEGAFLVEILKRKMAVAAKVSDNAKQFGDNALLALSTLYGIELMEDNVEMLVMNMVSTFDRNYYLTAAEQFDAVADHRVLKSAKTIIKANMAQGDTLKGIDAEGRPIVFSEWQPVGKTRVQRTVYTFEAIRKGGAAEPAKETEAQLSFLAPQPEPQERAQGPQYAVCTWRDIYLEKIESS